MAKLNKKVFLEKFLERHPSIRWVHEIKDPSKLSPEELEEYEEDIKLMRDWYATEIFEEQQLLQDQEESKKMEKIRRNEEFKMLEENTIELKADKKALLKVDILKALRLLEKCCL